MEYNFVIKNEFYEENKDLIEPLFGNDEIIYLENVDIYDLLVLSKLFKSRSEAKNNWKKTGKDIHLGFSDFENLGKRKDIRITIFNPIHVEE